MNIKSSLIIAASLAALTGAAHAQVSGYLTDSRGGHPKAAQSCVRTGYWSPAMAVMECDPDLVPKPAPAPVPAPKAEPAPPPPPPAPPAPVAPPPPPKPAVAPVLERVTLSADVLFEFDRAVLRPEGRARLDQLVQEVGGIALEVIIASGHADHIGSAAYNQRLSTRRAENVKAYLVSKGIEANRVYAEGKGEAQPVTGDKCAKMGRENRSNKKLVDCLQPDRRVEVEVIGTKQK